MIPLGEIEAARPSAGRPAHLPPSQDVHVEVRHTLLRIRATIGDAPKARVANALPIRDGGGRPRHFPDERFIGIADVSEAGDVLTGDHQDMHRRLRIDISKSQDVTILINDVGGNFSLRDAAKQALGHGSV
jgi:hypothetical protein